MNIRLSKASVGDEELAAVKEVFDMCYFGMGSRVQELEQRLRQYLGVGHVIAVNTGTSALHLALDALGIGPGDEVIVPSLTFVASFQAISATGARPVPCDVEPSTLLMDVDDLRRRISPRVRAIMPVHYTGNPCAMDEILSLAGQFGLRVVEDAAHALGSLYHGRKIGSFGDVVCFSFDGIKTITTGEGGAVVCFDRDLASLIQTKRLLGIDRDTEHRYRNTRTWLFAVHTQGYRYHMSNINAAIGLAQFDKIERFIARRQQICRDYVRLLRDLEGVQTLPIDYATTVPHIFVIRIRDFRDALARYLNANGIETGIHYVPNHLHPLYSRCGVTLPVTEAAYNEILTLPLHCDLTDDDVEHVVKSVKVGLRTVQTSRQLQ